MYVSFKTKRKPFGWVKDEGGDTHGETAADMYQNGNKIGGFG